MMENSSLNIDTLSSKKAFWRKLGDQSLLVIGIMCLLFSILYFCNSATLKPDNIIQQIYVIANIMAGFLGLIAFALCLIAIRVRR